MIQLSAVHAKATKKMNLIGERFKHVPSMKNILTIPSICLLVHLFDVCLFAGGLFIQCVLPLKKKGP